MGEPEDYGNVETVPQNACAYYEVCGNVVPGNGQVCRDCLDRVRKTQEEQDEVNWKK